MSNWDHVMRGLTPEQRAEVRADLRRMEDDLIEQERRVAVLDGGPPPVAPTPHPTPKTIRQRQAVLALRLRRHQRGKRVIQNFGMDSAALRRSREQTQAMRDAEEDAELRVIADGTPPPDPFARSWLRAGLVRSKLAEDGGFELQRARSKTEKLKKQLAAAREELAAAEKQLADADAQGTDLAAPLRTKVGDLKARVAKLEKELADSEGSSVSAKRSQRAQEDVEAAEESYRELQQQLSDARKAQRDAKERVDELQTAGASEADVTAARVRLDKAETLVAQLEKQCADAMQRLIDLYGGK